MNAKAFVFATTILTNSSSDQPHPALISKNKGVPKKVSTNNMVIEMNMIELCTK